MFIQTQDTPNPASLKFLPGRAVMAKDVPPLEFERGQDVSAAPLAEMLFSIPGIDRVFFGSDFISVTRSAASDWPHLKPAVLGAIMDYYVAGGAQMHETVQDDADIYEGDVLEIVTQIKELIDTRVRPAVAQDGGDIVFKKYNPDDGTVYVQMKGACDGCPSSAQTLGAGIENLLKHYVPEITRVLQA